MTDANQANDLQYREISELVDLLAGGDVTARGLTELMLDRIATVGEDLGAFAFVAGEHAMTQAEQSDARRRAGAARGPLDGVPLAIKDIFDKAGWRTEAGMAARVGQVATSSATVVDRLEEAGAVIVGKVHTTEGVYTEHTPPFRAPLNPWDADRWVGVSSSGSGVAPVAGLCFGALGSDTGGSIRMPSASNGATGLKPTWGRVSRAGAVELAATLDHIGPICRSALDAGLILAAIAGPDPRDPTASLRPVPEFGTHAPLSLKGIRIGIDPEWSYRDVSSDVEKAHREAEQSLRDLGAELTPISLPDPTEAITDWFGVCAVQTARAHRDLYPVHKDTYGPALAELIELGIAMSGMDYDVLLQRRLAFKGQMEAALDQVDATLIPAMSFIAPPVEKMIRMDDETTAGVHRFTVPFTLSQLPTITFPGGFTTTENGRPFPVGLQMVGSAFDERLLVDIVGAFQAETPWNKRHPAL